MLACCASPREEGGTTPPRTTMVPTPSAEPASGDVSRRSHRLTRHESTDDYKVQYVSQVDTLHNLPERARVQLALSMKDLHVPPGHCIIQQGDVGTEMYFVVDGSAEILIDSLDSQPVAAICAGQFFGETALLQADSRSAYVRSTTEMHLFVLTKQHLHAVIEAHPELQEMLVRAVQSRGLQQDAEPDQQMQPEPDSTCGPGGDPSQPQSVLNTRAEADAAQVVARRQELATSAPATASNDAQNTNGMAFVTSGGTEQPMYGQWIAMYDKCKFSGDFNDVVAFVESNPSTVNNRKGGRCCHAHTHSS